MKKAIAVIGWSGFEIHKGYITTPSGLTVTKEQVEHYHWIYRQMIDETKRCVALQEQLENISTVTEAANDQSTLARVYKIMQD